MHRIANRDFRRMLIGLNGLTRSPADATRGAERVRRTVQRLGFVQVDSVSAVARAHHHILFTRTPGYRRQALHRSLEADRTLFENWTHDAAILPVESFPVWKRYSERMRNFEVHGNYRRYFSMVGKRDIKQVLDRVEKNGPLKSRELGSRKCKNGWGKNFPSPTVAKVVMELLWRTGELAVTRRDKREKVYDLTERVIPAVHYKKTVSTRGYADWMCREALMRLGAGTPSQIALFFHGLSTQEATAWCRRRLGKEVVEVCVESANGSKAASCFALASVVENIEELPTAPRRLRLLNPFDPLIHDRKRTQKVFGFDFALEIFVPAAKRKYGYYVLPILEGERFTGRIDVKADRKLGRLNVLGLWWEPGVKVTPARKRGLERELEKLTHFVLA